MYFLKYFIINFYIHLHCSVILLNVLQKYCVLVTTYSTSTLKATVLDMQKGIQAALTLDVYNDKHAQFPCYTTENAQSHKSKTQHPSALTVFSLQL